MASNKDPHWIEHANLKKGAFGKKAKAAGVPTGQFAQDNARAPGKTGAQARLATVLTGLNK